VISPFLSVEISTLSFIISFQKPPVSRQIGCSFFLKKLISSYHFLKIFFNKSTKSRIGDCPRLSNSSKAFWLRSMSDFQLDSISTVVGRLFGFCDTFLRLILALFTIENKLLKFIGISSTLSIQTVLHSQLNRSIISLPFFLRFLETGNVGTVVIFLFVFLFSCFNFFTTHSPSHFKRDRSVKRNDTLLLKLYIHYTRIVRSLLDKTALSL
jgi:hypothetical protein